ncbi:hypothetical protein L484_011920 [Morus notabilis]|uniref:DUF4219 domain-containing protein n=1 Tax=Morus notabilis TaxID=981085 RepID=W9QIC1_9ROSA|nr:hypothetical protein L484_011920 [Morus notabilis]
MPIEGSSNNGERANTYHMETQIDSKGPVRCQCGLESVIKAAKIDQNKGRVFWMQPIQAEASFSPIAPTVFDGENYQIWAVHIETYLDALDLWEAVKED